MQAVRKINKINGKVKTMFEIIDEKLNIKVCDIADLSIEIFKNSSLNGEENQNILTVTAFRLDDALILNKRHAEYENIKAFAVKYMGADEEERVTIPDRLKADTYVAVVDEFEKVLAYRKAAAL